jgi:NO-binding membrane sensor protein with MHYT domain
MYLRTICNVFYILYIARFQLHEVVKETDKNMRSTAVPGGFSVGATHFVGGVVLDVHLPFRMACTYVLVVEAKPIMEFLI